jgi:hypothetical protein
MRSELNLPFVRVVSGVFGVAAALIAIVVLFSFITITLMEIDSMEQYQGHISILGAIGGTLLVVVITGSFGIGAYKLLRRAAGHS